MNTINDIQFDNNVFFPSDQWITVLYQLPDGPSIFIPIRRVDLLSFVIAYDDMIHYQNVVENTTNKRFVLFGYSDNIETWLWNNNRIPNNLEEINIFCPFREDIEYLRQFTNSRTDKVKQIFQYSSIERHLVIYGMDYIFNLINDYQNQPNVFQRLVDLYTSLSLVLPTLS